MLSLTQRQIDLITDAFRYAEDVADYTMDELAEIHELLGQLDREFDELTRKHLEADLMSDCE